MMKFWTNGGQFELTVAQPDISHLGIAAFLSNDKRSRHAARCPASYGKVVNTAYPVQVCNDFVVASVWPLEPSERLAVPRVLNDG